MFKTQSTQKKKCSCTIEILSNTRAKIVGLDKRSTNVIDDALAMPVPGAQYNRSVRYGRWDGKRHLFYAPTSTFPKGLLRRVEKLLKELQVKYDVKDHRVLLPPPSMSRLKADMLKGVTFDASTGVDYSFQLEATRLALVAGSGILWIATGGGKTELMCAIIKVLKEHRALVLVHKKTLLHQTRERIAKRLGTIEEHIGIIGDSRFDPKHITVATVQSLTRKGKHADILKKYFKTIGVLVLDETHHAKSTTWYKLANRIPAQYRYGLSGTPFGSGNGLMVEAVCGPVINHVSNDQLIELGVNARPTIEMIEVRKPVLDASMDWQDVYKEGIVLNEERNALIIDNAVRFSKEKLPVLILVKELWHGDQLASVLREKKVKHAFVHGQMPLSMVEKEKIKFEDKKLDVLIASPIFDEGVDVPVIRALIIADGGKSVRAVLQKIGRGLRKKDGDNTLTVVDFADCTHRFLAKHSMERLAIYENEGFLIKE